MPQVAVSRVQDITASAEQCSLDRSPGAKTIPRQPVAEVAALAARSAENRIQRAVLTCGNQPQKLWKYKFRHMSQWKVNRSLSITTHIVHQLPSDQVNCNIINTKLRYPVSPCYSDIEYKLIQLSYPMNRKKYNRSLARLHSSSEIVMNDAASVVTRVESRVAWSNDLKVSHSRRQKKAATEKKQQQAEWPTVYTPTRRPPAVLMEAYIVMTREKVLWKNNTKYCSYKYGDARE